MSGPFKDGPLRTGAFPTAVPVSGPDIAGHVEDHARAKTVKPHCQHSEVTAASRGVPVATGQHGGRLTRIQTGNSGPMPLRRAILVSDLQAPDRRRHPHTSPSSRSASAACGQSAQSVPSSGHRDDPPPPTLGIRPTPRMGLSHRSGQRIEVSLDVPQSRGISVWRRLPWQARSNRQPT